MVDVGAIWLVLVLRDSATAVCLVLVYMIRASAIWLLLVLYD